jgi:hypothetical protein
VRFFLILSFFVSSCNATELDCLMDWAERGAPSLIKHSSDATNQTQGKFEYRYYDITNSYLALESEESKIYFYAPNTSEDIVEVGYFEYWLSASECHTEANPIIPTSTSYENKNHPEVVPFTQPIELMNPDTPIDESQAVAFADFLGNGSMQIMTNPVWGAFGVDGPFWGTKSPIQFWSYDNTITKWVEITELLIDEQEGCILARKAVVADFNGDSLPDVYLACTGKDQQELMPDGTYRIDSREDSKIVMSNDQGRYDVVTLALDCYCHTASAADINGDGYVDIFAPDSLQYAQNEDGVWVPHRGRDPYFLINDGKGNFTVSHDGIPKIEDRIWTTEILDFDYDGNLDIWVAGSKLQYILFGDGTGDFTQRIVEIPQDEKYDSAMDMLYIEDMMYIYSVDVDYSKPHYYWGDALREVNWVTGTATTLYEHEDTYYTKDICEGVVCKKWFGEKALDTWYPWIILTTDGIRPLFKEYNFLLTTAVKTGD